MTPRLIGVVDPLREDLHINAARLATSLRAREDGFDVIAANTIDMLPLERLSGLVYHKPIKGEPERLQQVAQTGLPVVAVNSPVESIPFFGIDYNPGMREAIGHLKSLGHERIAYMKGPPQWSSSAVRLQSFINALETNGISYDPDLVAHTDWDYYKAHDAMVAMLKAGKKFTAVVTGGDRAAVGCIYAARQSGLSVPEDMAVVGCGNLLQVQTHYDHSLSTIFHPIYNTAYEAAHDLIEHIKDPSIEIKSRSTPTSLVVRYSTIGEAYSNPFLKASFTEDSGILSYLLSISGSLKSNDIESYQTRFDQCDGNAYSELKDILLEASLKGLDSMVVHHALVDLGNRLSVWDFDNPASSLREKVVSTLYNLTFQDAMFFSRFSEHIEQRVDVMLGPLRNLAEEKQSITNYVDALEQFRISSGARELALVVFAAPCKNLKAHDENALIWRFDRLGAMGPEPIRINESYTLSEIFPPSKAPQFIDAMPLTTEEGMMGILFLDMDTKYGNYYRKILPIISGKLQRTRLFAFLQEKQIELQNQAHELIKQKSIAESASNAKSEFLAVMSHEIRTPLNCILGMAEIAMLSDLSEEQSQYLQKIKEGGLELLTLISDLLDFSKIEAGQISLIPKPFNLRNLVENSIEKHQQRIEEKRLTVDSVLDEELPDSLIGDAHRLQQVINNLLGNAIKFTDKGSINIRVFLKDSSDDKIDTLFEVEDTGIGVPEDKKNAIFNSFEQVDSSDSRVHGGIGLGLSIAKQLTNAMGGDVWLERSDISGSTFRFSVKLERNTSLPIKERPAISEKRTQMTGRSANILLVDDKETNRHVARMMLRSTPHKLIEASGGDDAIEKAKLQEFDLILMDIRMPGIDGLDTTKAIREHEAEKLAKPAIIFALTSHAIKGYEETCLNAGMDGYITKPIRKEEFLTTIERALKMAST